MKLTTSALLTLSLLAPCSLVWSQDRLLLDGTKVTGSRELPKVLYVVAWKKPLPGELAGRPQVTVLDEALAPIDRDVFRRQVIYNSAMQSAPAAAPAVANK